MNKHEGNDTHHAAEDAARCILSMKPVDDGGRVLDRTNDGIGRTMGSDERWDRLNQDAELFDAW
jgi:hypothetical protein